MSAIELNGKSLATQMQAELATEVAAFVAATQVTPKLAAVLVGDDPASQVYVRNKQRACEKAGIASVPHRLAVDTCEADLLALIADLNQDPSIHGILIQLPLPKGIDATRVLDAVSPLKDVDAIHPENVRLHAQGRPRYLP